MDEIIDELEALEAEYDCLLDLDPSMPEMEKKIQKRKEKIHQRIEEIKEILKNNDLLQR